MSSCHSRAVHLSERDCVIALWRHWANRKRPPVYMMIETASSSSRSFHSIMASMPRCQQMIAPWRPGFDSQWGRLVLFPIFLNISNSFLSHRCEASVGTGWMRISPLLAKNDIVPLFDAFSFTKLLKYYNRARLKILLFCHFLLY